MTRELSLDAALYASAGSPVDQYYLELMASTARTPLPTDSRKPRITLVVGPSPFTMPRGWEFFLTAPYEGISLIATVLHNAGFPVRIVDVRYTPDPVNAAWAQIQDGTDVLGIATYEDNFPFVEELIALSKQKRPELPIMLGGSLVTSVPQVFMAHTRADILCIGEGELTVLELADAFFAGDWRQRVEGIRGIWYRTDGGEARANPPRGQMFSLDLLPTMNLSLWPQAKGPKGLQPQIISSYSRGCKMDCSFCFRTTPQERVKSPEKLRAELKQLKEQYQIEFVFFVDLTFTAHKAQTLQYCEVIKEFDIRWCCMTRVADVDADILRAMAESGCDIILFGVESLSPAVLAEARKGSGENLVLRAMRLSKEAGVRFGGLTIVGLPSETEETLDHMCDWAEENRHITRVKFLSSMPGTTVYRQGLARGIIKDELDHLRWLSIEQALERDEFLSYTTVSPDAMRRAYHRLYRAYQPGPVMDFKHFPDHFEYFDPIPGCSWRSKFSSAAAPLMPGHERFRRGYGISSVSSNPSNDIQE